MAYGGEARLVVPAGGSLSASANEAKREGSERFLYIGASATSRALFHHRSNSRLLEDKHFSLAFTPNPIFLTPHPFAFTHSVQNGCTGWKSTSGY